MTYKLTLPGATGRGAELTRDGSDENLLATLHKEYGLGVTKIEFACGVDQANTLTLTAYIDSSMIIEVPDEAAGITVLNPPTRFSEVA